MLKKGMKKSVISKRLGVNRKTVYNWSVKLEQSGDWHDRKQPGSKSKLTKDQKEKLKRIIDGGPRSYGYDTDLWTLKRISEVISALTRNAFREQIWFHAQQFRKFTNLLWHLRQN